MSQGKERLDALLVEQGYFDSREKAKAAIMAGLVCANGEKVDKPGTKLSRDVRITVKGAPHPYVSRGGLKLEKALRLFGIDLRGAVVIDVGASTGGFTDCALQHGASLVYAVDVGYNQLDWKLRNDPRVVVMERTNFRYAEPDILPGPKPTFATVDVSFISLSLMFGPLRAILAPTGEAVVLIKPQFEAGRDKVGRAGVVRDPKTHRDVLRSVLKSAVECGFWTKGLTFSPITGGDGNVEFLAHLTANGNDPSVLTPAAMEAAIENVVRESSETFASRTHPGRFPG
jgi:23S rRNA (cytidine1920-2'-O)/16S rRNA (cytidine1409-2'-O)-methyltransferase